MEDSSKHREVEMENFYCARCGSQDTRFRVGNDSIEPDISRKFMVCNSCYEQSVVITIEKEQYDRMVRFMKGFLHNQLLGK